jgi:anti-sigma regulatory factor (Ser/Thr protein kinase)
MRPNQSAPPQPAAPGTHLGAGPIGPLEVTLTAGTGAPAAARAHVMAWLAGHAGPATIVDARLAISELVTNSIQHAGAPVDAPIHLRASVAADVLSLEIQDRGTGGAITRRTPDLQHGGGFGLNVVDVVSRRWGVDRGAGTRVWAELAFSAAGPHM